MKTNILYSMLLLVALLPSCNSDERFGSETYQSGSGTIELTVSAGEFLIDGAPDTRAADNGDAITFDSGDRIGLIIFKGDGTLLANNIPYVYDGSQWTFDASTASSEGSNKQQCYNDYVANNLTYIVYYPYSASVDGVMNENDLKGKFVPKENQQSEDAYRSSDLMVWKSSSAQPLKKLSAELKHAYASVSLSPSMKCRLADGSDTEVFYVPSGVSDVSFTIDNDICDPYQASDGSFRCILPVSFTSGDIRYFYTFEDKTYGGTLAITKATSNTRYTSTQQIKDLGTYDMGKVTVGDFYCMNSSNVGYLVPADAAFLDDGINCLGIVYWVGNKAIEDDALLKDKHSECTHGLVVGLHEFGGDTNGMHWSDSYEFILDHWINKEGNPYKDKVNTYEQNKLCGYSNTVAMTDYNKGSGDGIFPSKVKDNNGYRVLPCVAINEYAGTHITPTASSGWYFPSIYELKYMCWGQGNTQGVVGRDLLNRQIGKVSSKLDASPFSSADYWSSTEGNLYGLGYNDAYAWFVGFGSGYTNRYVKNDSYLVRPSLAF